MTWYGTGTGSGSGSGGAGTQGGATAANQPALDSTSKAILTAIEVFQPYKSQTETTSLAANADAVVTFSQLTQIDNYNVYPQGMAVQITGPNQITLNSGVAISSVTVVAQGR